MKQYKVVITEDALEQARKYLLYRAIDQQQPETAAKWWHKAFLKPLKRSLSFHNAVAMPTKINGVTTN